MPILPEYEAQTLTGNELLRALNEQKKELVAYTKLRDASGGEHYFHCIFKNSQTLKVEE